MQTSDFVTSSLSPENTFISLRVRKCGFTHASRAEISIFTPRDIKFRTILVRKNVFLWLHHSPPARAANSHSSENVSSHSYRNVLFSSTDRIILQYVYLFFTSTPFVAIISWTRTKAKFSALLYKSLCIFTQLWKIIVRLLVTRFF